MENGDIYGGIMTTGQFAICDCCKRIVATEKCELCGGDMCNNHTTFIALNVGDSSDCEFGFIFQSSLGDMKICTNCRDRLRKFGECIKSALNIGRHNEQRATKDQRKIRKEICNKILSIVYEEEKVFVI